MKFTVESKYNIGYKFSTYHKNTIMKAEVVLVELCNEGDEIYRIKYLAEMENKERCWLSTSSMEAKQ